MPLEQESKIYQDRLGELLDSQGKYVLIHQQQIVGICDRYEDALRRGYELFGLNPFLVKKIQATEAVHHFTRGLQPCRT